MLCKMETTDKSHKDDIANLPEALTEHVQQLPDILRRSRADSTCRKYEYGFLRWKKWALLHGIQTNNVLPAKDFPVALYLVSLIQTASSPSAVISAFYSIKWAHDLCGFRSPTDSKLVSNVLESSKRILATATVKKLPITVDVLRSMFDRLYEHGNLYNQRIICASLLAFSGFLRSSELLNIRVSDLMFEHTHMAVFLETSKTDVYMDGAWVLIAKTGSDLCPVSNTQRFITWSDLSGEDFLLCNLSKTKNGYQVRKNRNVMSYSNLREQFRNAFAPHVPDINKFCLHSLRAGGATAAAGGGVPDRMFKRHGRWVSDRAKDGYVQDELKERLSVSLSLGL